LLGLVRQPDPDPLIAALSDIARRLLHVMGGWIGLSGVSKTISVDGRVGAQLANFHPRDTLRRSSASWGNFSPAAARLAFPRHIGKALVVVWDQPYLETCCRSALHRLQLSRRAGRPPDLLDGKCLLRIASMGLCDQRPDGRFVISAEGIRRHAAEVLQRPFR
jgi:hypothetical protein